jgi:hypothetical protein
LRHSLGTPTSGSDVAPCPLTTALLLPRGERVLLGQAPNACSGRLPSAPTEDRPTLASAGDCGSAEVVVRHARHSSGATVTGAAAEITGRHDAWPSEKTSLVDGHANTSSLEDDHAARLRSEVEPRVIAPRHGQHSAVMAPLTASVRVRPPRPPGRLERFELLGPARDRLRPQLDDGNAMAAERLAREPSWVLDAALHPAGNGKNSLPTCTAPARRRPPRCGWASRRAPSGKMSRKQGVIRTAQGASYRAASGSAATPHRRQLGAVTRP